MYFSDADANKSLVPNILYLKFSHSKFGNASVDLLQFIRAVVLCILNIRQTQHMFTSWNTAFPEKLTGSQLVTKFPAYFEIRRLNTAFTRVRHLSLS